MLLGDWKRETQMEILGPEAIFPLVPSRELGPALSQCCIRALGARTRSAGPSPLSRGANPLPPRVSLAFCRDTLRRGLRCARPVWASPLGSLEKGRDRLVPALVATRPGAGARGQGRAPA